MYRFIQKNKKIISLVMIGVLALDAVVLFLTDTAPIGRRLVQALIYAAAFLVVFGAFTVFAAVLDKESRTGKVVIVFFALLYSIFICLAGISFVLAPSSHYGVFVLFVSAANLALVRRA